MTKPSYHNAANRDAVRLADGATGRLVYLPSSQRKRSRHRSKSKAIVLLPGGHHINVDPDAIELIKDQGP